MWLERPEVPEVGYAEVDMGARFYINYDLCVKDTRESPIVCKVYGQCSQRHMGQRNCKFHRRENTTSLTGSSVEQTWQKKEPGKYEDCQQTIPTLPNRERNMESVLGVGWTSHQKPGKQYKNEHYKETMKETLPIQNVIPNLALNNSINTWLANQRNAPLSAEQP